MLRRSQGGHRARMRPALGQSLVVVLALACSAVVVLAPGAQAGRAALTSEAPLDRQQLMHSSRQLLQADCTTTTCSTEVKQVCATNPLTTKNETYSNACLAGCASAPVQYRGPCYVPPEYPVEECRCEAPSSGNYSPVCASNPQTGITSTYHNSCQAGCGQFPVVNQGPCEEDVPPTGPTTGPTAGPTAAPTEEPRLAPTAAPTAACTCTKEYVPMCATSPVTGLNETYGNACMAGCASAPVVYRGECYVPPDPPIACRCAPQIPDNYEPVCASNPETGVTSTYYNSCAAGCGLWPVVYEGPCEGDEPTPAPSAPPAMHRPPKRTSRRRRRRGWGWGK